MKKRPALVLDDERLLRAAARKSLREFVRQAFNIVVPAEPFMASWHTDSICDHLEALRRREIRNILITMPPRHLKSTIVSVLFPRVVVIRSRASANSSMKTLNALRRYVARSWRRERGW